MALHGMIEWILALLGITVLAHLLIHIGLRAPRIRETGTPACQGLPFRRVVIRTVRGKRLFGWFIAANGHVPAPTVAILHGWGGNAEMMLPLAGPLHRAGYSVLLFDARGHGRSDGDTFASLPRFAEDLDHVLNWLATRATVDTRRLYAIGHSVGAGAVLLAAARRHDLAAVVSIAAFADPESMMRRFLTSYRIPYPLPGAYILRYVQRVIGHRFADIAPVNTIARIRCPVLLVHGHDDTTVPVTDAARIHAGRRDNRVCLQLLSGSHDTFADPERQATILLDFLAETGGGAPVTRA
ncbi:MAG: alpha/beta fold hydrolase [Candidatus Competibacteraceae bacterium]|nr:MAG: alpha/beta fold hydrolase [Candidatus Competibacteraceae bacterium]